MIFILAFLLSWLAGMIVILVLALFVYQHFSLIDIFHFMVMSLIPCLLAIPLFYYTGIKLLSRHSRERRLFYFPLYSTIIGNLPLYIITWYFSPELYGNKEAMLFTVSFFVSGLVFGSCYARKIKEGGAAK